MRYDLVITTHLFVISAFSVFNYVLNDGISTTRCQTIVGHRVGYGYSSISGISTASMEIQFPVLLKILTDTHNYFISSITVGLPC